MTEQKKRSRWLGPLLGSIGVILAVGLVFAGLVGVKAWQVSHMEGGPPPESPTSVELATAHSTTIRQSASAIGTVVAPRSIVLSNEVPGTVAKIQLVPGTIVDAGTVLVELDTSVEAAQLESAKASMKMAKSRYERTRQAQRNNALTEFELDEAESLLAQAQARMAELEAIIARKTLVAPFKSRVGISYTHEGQFLQSGTEITSLQSVDGFLYIDFTLPQHVSEFVTPGHPVRLNTDEHTYLATIEALDSRTDRLTRNLLARARLDAAPASMKPGDSVKVQIDYGPEIPAVAVPIEAVRRTPGGTNVFVTKTDDQGELRAYQRGVQIVRTSASEAIISTGIVDGDSVVATGSFKLLDGGLVQDVVDPGTPVSQVGAENK